MVKEKESQIQKTILDYLRYRKVFCWKQNTVGIYKQSTGSYIPSQSVGAPDIFAVKNGKVFGIEVKTKTGKQSDNQKNFQQDFEKAGGIYLVARSIEDVQKHCL